MASLPSIVIRFALSEKVMPGRLKSCHAPSIHTQAEGLLLVAPASCLQRKGGGRQDAGATLIFYFIPCTGNAYCFWGITRCVMKDFSAPGRITSTSMISLK